MNAVYPKTSSDFDLEFLRHSLRAIFTKGELRNCASLSSLKELNRGKLQFAKGDNNNFNLSCVKVLHYFFLLIIMIGIYQYRVGNDKKRFDAFRRFAIEIGEEI